MRGSRRLGSSPRRRLPRTAHRGAGPRPEPRSAFALFAALLCAALVLASMLGARP